MKYCLLIILGIFAFSSCEEVVQLDLDTAAERLVIDARIIQRTDEPTFAVVQLSRTASFYTEDNPHVTDATVFLTDDEGVRYDLNHSDSGRYASPLPNNFPLSPDVEIELTVIDGNETYKATASYAQTVPIEEVETEEVAGLDDLTRISAFYQDPEETGNYYLFTYVDEFNVEIDTGDDEFSNGNLTPTIFFIEELEQGAQARVIIEGLDRRAFDFYNILLSQSDGGSAGPFGTQPAEVRGNIVNVTDAEHYPYGYFRFSQVYDFDFTIE